MSRGLSYTGFVAGITSRRSPATLRCMTAPTALGISFGMLSPSDFTPEEQAQIVALARRLPPPMQSYRADPVGFVHRILGEETWSGQDRILQAVRDERHVAVQACFGPGKSWTAARLVCWWLSVWPEGSAFAVTTAPTFNQVRAILWQEIARAHAGRLPGRLNQTEWLIGDRLVGLGRSPKDTASTLASPAFQGIHAERVLAVIDEASGVSPSVFAAVEGFATTEGSRVLAIGNPDDPSGEFARRCARWHNIRLSAFDTPAFTGEQVSAQLSRVLVSKTWVEERRAEWGEGSPLWKSRVLGEFPDTAEDALFSLAGVQAATVRELDAGEPTVVSCDVARFGSDKTIIGLRQGNRYRQLLTLGQSSVTEVTGHCVRAFREHGGTIHVDEVGVGGGVVDSLREQGLPVLGLNAGAGAMDSQRFANTRAEWFWGLRERMAEIAIPADPELIAELVGLRWKVDARGRILVESKEDMRKRGMRSPDKADALMLAFAGQGRMLEGPLGV